MLIIGITGPAETGKSTFSKYLIKKLKEKYPKRTIKKIIFARKVKKIAAKQFGWKGEKDLKWRKILQLIGKIGRLIDEDYFIKDFWEQTQKQNNNSIIIPDDVRFENEAKFIREKNGFIIHIRPIDFDLSESWRADESETGIVFGNRDIVVISKKEKIKALDMEVDKVFEELIYGNI